jgi:hypothetical protein
MYKKQLDEHYKLESMPFIVAIGQVVYLTIALVLLFCHVEEKMDS